MTVNEALSILGKAAADGFGDDPFQMLVVESGIPYARNLSIFPAQEYDGRRVWVASEGEDLEPGWMTSVRKGLMQ